MPAIAEIKIYQETREKEVNRFGAFIQIFKKKGNNIACYSYPLESVSTGEARRITSSILSPDKEPAYRYESESLLFMARPGLHEIEHRYLTIPEVFLGVDQSKRRLELDNGLKSEFEEMLAGKRHTNAQVSKGQEMFTLSYRVKLDPETGELGVFGLPLQGEEQRLSRLQIDEEHAEMLKALEKVLLAHDEITIVNFSKHKTVSLCCAKFFKDKLVNGIKSIGDSFFDTLSFYFGNRLAQTPLESSKFLCDQCGEDMMENHSCRENS